MNILKIFFLLVSFCFFSQGNAQSLSMKLKMKDFQGNYPLIIKANSHHFAKYILDKDIKIGSHIDDYFTIYLPSSLISDLYKQPFIFEIQDGAYEMRPMMDSSRILNNIDSVHAGSSPLISNYKGRNVLIGIIDFGIEWRHLDFKKSQNDSRILGVWDQNKDSIPPQGYSYGHFWSKKDIDSGICTHNASSQFGHGTNVAGIAAGNGNTNLSYRGVATESHVIAVSLKNNNAWLSNIVDGAQFIFQKADSLGLPCVINISIGGYDGSHDGTDPSSRMLEALLNKKGRAIVAAAGNAGNFNQHIRFQPNMDTSFTDFVYTSAYGGSYFNFWADTADVLALKIGIQADSQTTLLPLSQKYFFDFKSRFLDSLQKYGYYEDSLEIKNLSDSSIGMAYFYVLKQEKLVNFQCYIVPKKTTYLWRFTATGQGTIEMWVHGSLQTTSNIVTSLPSSSVNSEIINYKLADQNMSIVSGFQCSDKIITVGNYHNKNGYLDIDSIYRSVNVKQGEIAGNSSKGPTRDGRIKPDISASGSQTLTTIDSVTSANFALSATNRKKLGYQGKYSIGGGTSMASPVVAGSIGLLFEKYPNLDNAQLMYLLKKTAKRDSFTTASENNSYGYGKINAFQLLSYRVTYGCRDTGSVNYNPNSDFEDSSLCIKKVYGCMDTGSVNYNPKANVDNGSCIKKIYGCTDTGSINFNINANTDDGSCIKKVYGCTDSLAVNFDPKANVDDGSCLYPVAVNEPNLSEIKIYPNPASNIVRIESQNINSKWIEVTNSLGQRIYSSYFKDKHQIAVENWNRGIYFLKIIGKSHTLNISLVLR